MKNKFNILIYHKSSNLPLLKRKKKFIADKKSHPYSILQFIQITTMLQQLSKYNYINLNNHKLQTLLGNLKKSTFLKTSLQIKFMLTNKYLFFIRGHLRQHRLLGVGRYDRGFFLYIFDRFYSQQGCNMWYCVCVICFVSKNPGGHTSETQCRRTQRSFSYLTPLRSATAPHYGTDTIL